MHLAPTLRQHELRAELREYFARLIPGETSEALRAEPPGGPLARGLLKRIAADGLLGLGWPIEYGGQGRGPDEQFVFFDESYRAGAPVSMVTLNTVGPTLMKYGTPAQKEYFLPRILSGDCVFAIGYTEPDAGTDLASLRTRAVRTGPVDGPADGPVGGDEGGDEGGGSGEWLIDGNKTFTSNAQGADWIWLACRTDPGAPKHKGISIILVPTDAPGFSWTPIHTVGGQTTSATYYDAIRVPYGNLVGEENAGWSLITNQLNHERVALAAIGMQAEDFYDEALASARTPGADGTRRIDTPWVASRLAEAHARLSATRLLNWRLVQDVGAGTLTPGDASGVKFAGTESAIEVYRALQEAVGETALIRGGESGELERMNRAAQINTFGGGVSEVQREIVATMRLGMKRSKR